MAAPSKSFTMVIKCFLLVLLKNVQESPCRGTRVKAGNSCQNFIYILWVNFQVLQVAPYSWIFLAEVLIDADRSFYFLKYKFPRSLPRNQSSPKKTWEGLAQIDLLVVWICPFQIWALLLDGIFQHHPQVLATSAKLSHMPLCHTPGFAAFLLNFMSWKFQSGGSHPVLLLSEILGDKSSVVSAHSYLWHDRNIAMPLGSPGPRVALDGCSPSAFEGWGLSRWHSPSTPLGHWDVGGHVAANIPTRCYQMQSGFFSSDFLSKALQKQLSWI